MRQLPVLAAAPLPFRSVWWLRNAHLQTLGATLAPRSPERTELERFSVALPSFPDGDRLAVEAGWHPGKPRPTLLLVHGLGGSFRSAYVIRARRFFFAAGYHVVAVTLRGSGLHAAPATSLYHAGLTEDVAAVLTHLEKDKRVAGLGIVGFSLGGHVTLRLASLWGDRPPSSVRAIATISTPFDLHATVAHLDAWPQFAYRWYLLRALLHNARRLFTHVPAHRQRRVPRIRTLREYDEHVVAPMHGFASADAYYAEVSCGPRLGAIRIPTWLLHAVDDPMVPLSTLAPFWNRPSPFLTFRQTRRGGHAGFFENTRDGLASPWSLVQALPFLQTHLPLL